MTAATTMTVGELARRSGVPVKALRDYTDWGLIDSLGRSPANYRLYTSDSLWCVHAITQLRGLGLTLAEIRQAARVAGEGPDAVGPVLAEQLCAARVRVERQMAELEQVRHRIGEYEAVHRDALAGQASLWPDAPQPDRRGSGLTLFPGVSPYGRDRATDAGAAARPVACGDRDAGRRRRRR